MALLSLSGRTASPCLWPRRRSRGAEVAVGRLEMIVPATTTCSTGAASMELPTLGGRCGDLGELVDVTGVRLGELEHESVDEMARPVFHLVVPLALCPPRLS